MSTNAIIAQAAESPEESWRGVYCHWDGYPTALGAKIWALLHTRFRLNASISEDGRPVNPRVAVRAFCSITISGHPGGWSSFDSLCYCHDEYFVMRDGMKDFTMGPENVGSNIEWIYILDPQTLTLTVQALRLEHTDGEAAPDPHLEGGVVDYGYCLCRWEKVAEVDLLGDEPDWRAIEGV